MSGPDEIAETENRQSAITSHSIGVPELTVLLNSLGPDATDEDYRRAVIDENVLGLATDNGRQWRYKTLRRLYYLRSDSLLFRSLRALWASEVDAGPLLACLCALATDTTFRATAAVIVQTSPGDEVASADFASAVDETYPDAYASSTMKKVGQNAYASWEQTGHLGPSKRGHKDRTRASCQSANVAYALMLGHIQGFRGEALFDTVWARVLDQPRSHLFDLAFDASRRGMIEFRSAGGVVEVGFRELLRPLEEAPS